MIDPRDATLALLARRAPGATVCPSDVTRAITPDWRAAMPLVHAAVDGLVRDGVVRLSWKGQRLAARSGPYRIGRPGDDQLAARSLIGRDVAIGRRWRGRSDI